MHSNNWLHDLILKLDEIILEGAVQFFYNKYYMVPSANFSSLPLECKQKIMKGENAKKLKFVWNWY